MACYEFLRTIRQREDEAARLAQKNGEEPEVDAISRTIEFSTLFTTIELLRMPIANFEIAKDKAMKEPLVMRSIDGGSQHEVAYDKTDPGRFHVLQGGGTSPKGLLGWQAIDHANSRVFWIERRALSDSLLECAAKVEPAGIREARLRAEAEQATEANRGVSAPDR